MERFTHRQLASLLRLLEREELCFCLAVDICLGVSLHGCFRFGVCFGVCLGNVNFCLRISFCLRPFSREHNAEPKPHERLELDDMWTRMAHRGAMTLLLPARVLGDSSD